MSDREAQGAAPAADPRASGERPARGDGGPIRRWRARREEDRAMRAEARRFTARRRRGRRRLWIALGSAGALVLFVAIGLFTPVMAVREIAVEGAQRLAPAQIEAALSDLRGRPLALVTDADVGARVGSIVEVQSYSVRAEPPSRLVVEIVERQRVGALDFGDRFEVVDAAGVLLERTQAPPADVPVLLTGGTSTQTAGFAAASSVMLAMPAELRAQVGTVEAGSIDSVRLTLRDGDVVVWGSAERSEDKARVLALLRSTAGADVRTYDVTSPDRPVTRTS